MVHQGLHEAWLPRGVDEPPGRRADPRFAGEQWEEGRGQPRVTEEGWGSPRRRQDRLGALGEVQFVAAAISAFPFCSTMVLAISFEAILHGSARSRIQLEVPKGTDSQPVGAWRWGRGFSFHFHFLCLPSLLSLRPLWPIPFLSPFSVHLQFHTSTSSLFVPLPLSSPFFSPPNSSTQFALGGSPLGPKKRDRPCSALSELTG